MKRKVIKLDDKGNEMTDDQGNFIFEEIEIESQDESDKDNKNEITAENLEETVSKILKTQLNIDEQLPKNEKKEPEEKTTTTSLGFNVSTFEIN